ncbi:MAG: hypothetical protein WBI20_09075 [Burkholderiaceae bacterium]
MKKNTAFVLSFVAILLALTAAGSWVWWKSNTPNARARELVRSELLEPNAYHFNAMRQDPASKAVCGRLLARDSQGRFEVLSASFVVSSDGQLWLEPTDSTQALVRQQESLSTEQKQLLSALKKEACPSS